MEEQPGDAGLITSDPFGAYDESSNQDTDDIASNQGMCNQQSTCHFHKIS